MPKDRERFIADLVSSHTPRPPLALPGRRALRWCLAALAVTVTLLWLVQPFRPGCLRALCGHPLRLVELLSGLLCVGWGATMALVGSTPGTRLSLASRCVAGLSAVVFAVSLVVASIASTPESSSIGHRPYCWMEVLVYGGASLGAMLWMAHRSYLRFTAPTAIWVGLAAGLVPALLMQLACVYDPCHGLAFHYGPILLLVGLGAWLVKRLAR
ncbi:MAG: DUF1109 family protein [Lentisphaerae bacterium]|nr:DUF1109 family protein [Lentisphaerota bacterium]